MTFGPYKMPRSGALQHEALFYLGDDDYIAGVRSFVEAGLAAAEPVLVAVPGPRVDLLRAAFDSIAGLRFVDMAREGRNPAWIIPGVLHAFGAEHRGTAVRIVDEPIWPDRSISAYPRCVQHEALINVALANRPANILCPYDASRLDADVIADAASTHPVLIRDGDRQVSFGYGSPKQVVDFFNRPLTEPAPSASTLFFDAAGLSGLRALVAALASGAGLAADRVGDLQIAVNEVAANAVTHSAAPAMLRVWADQEGMHCDVTGSSMLTNRLAGRIPAPPTDDRGRGLLLVNYLCDLVHVHTTDESTTVRVQMNW